MRTTQKSRVLGPSLDGFATIPELPAEGAVTDLFLRAEPVPIDAPAPRARGSTPIPPAERLARQAPPAPPPVHPRVRPSSPPPVGRLARPSSPPPVHPRVRPSSPPPVERFARASTPPPIDSGAQAAAAAAYDSAPRLEPRFSTAPAVSRVARSGPRPIPAALAAPAPAAASASSAAVARFAHPVAPPRRIAWGRVVVAIALVSALLGAGIAKLLYRGRGTAAAPPAAAAAAAAPATSLVAVLPFENRSADPALGPAPAALAKVLADELAARAVLELAVLDAGGSPDPARGAADERARGAAAIVRGSLADQPGGGVQVRVEVVRRGGKPVTVLERTAPAGEVADAVRAGVPAFAGLLVDPRELPRHLELGHLALVEDRAADARRRFDTVLLHDPNHAAAIYERALLAPVPAALDDALAAPLAPAQREVIAAYRELADARFPDAITAFAALAARRPGDFHVLRGLFEAQLRGGRAPDAIRTYGRLRALEPRTRVGLSDVLAYAVAHPGAPDLAWAGPELANLAAPPATATATATGAGAAGPVRPEPERALLARLRIADRDYPGAAALLSAADPALAARDPELAAARLQLALATGRLDDLPAAAAALEPRRPASHLAYRLALAHARGDAAALARGLAPAELGAIDRADAAELAELVPIAIALGHAELLERVVGGLDRQRGPEQRGVAHQLARTLLGDTAASIYPEVDAVAQAIAAERAGDWAVAAAAWRSAARLSPDGRTLSVEQLGLARALHRAGDLEGAAAACRDVLAPRVLQPHWGVAAGDCYAWSIEAALDRRDRAAALELVERLAALRAPAGALDPMLRRARALLVQ